MTQENEIKVEYLKGYLKALNIISRCKRTIETIKSDIEELRRNESEAKCSPITGLPKAKNCNNKDLSEYMMQLDHYERQIQDLIKTINSTQKEAAEECTKIYIAINEMQTEKYKDILTAKFIERESWKEMSIHFGYTRDGMYKTYIKALDEFKIPA